jgi:hypothetical protein
MQIKSIGIDLGKTTARTCVSLPIKTEEPFDCVFVLPFVWDSG